MIRMIKGTYGRVVGGTVEAMTKHSGPFSLSEAREAELVAAGVAEKVEDTAQSTDYEKLRLSDLRKAAAVLGVDVSAAKTKKEVIDILKAAEAENASPVYHEEEQYSGLLAEE